MAPAIIIIIIKTINLLTSIPSFLFSFAFCFVPFRFHWFYIRIENRSERMKYTRYIYIYTWDDRREKKVATAHPRQPVLRSLYDPLAFQFKAHRLTITSFPPRSVVLRRMGGTQKKNTRGRYDRRARTNGSPEHEIANQKSKKCPVHHLGLRI